MRWMPDMTGPEIERLLGGVPVLLPVGSLEQHGPHLPVDTDEAIARAFALAIAAEVGAMVAPGLGYGYRSQPASGGGEIFAATTSLSGQVLCDAVHDVLCALVRHGQSEFALINGHYENAAFLVEAASRTVLEHPETRVVLLNWWEVADQHRLDAIFSGQFPGWAAEHAGVVETSLMMHLDRHRVREDLIEKRMASVDPPRFTILPERPGLVDGSGVLRTADGSSAAIGEAIFLHVVDRSCDILRTELRTAQAATANADEPTS